MFVGENENEHKDYIIEIWYYFLVQIIFSQFLYSQLQVAQRTYIVQVSSYFTEFLMCVKILSSSQCGMWLQLICIVIVIH